MKKLIALTLLSAVVSAPAFAMGDADQGKQKSATCSACHGADGNSTVSQWPKLAGQKQSYIVQQLMDYKAGDTSGRQNPVMAGIVAGLSTQDMQDLAAYFNGQAGTVGAASPELVEKGQQLYRGGDMDHHITACSACHGPQGQGIETAVFPKLSGQHAEYIVQQLQAFKSGQRANDLNGMMRDIAAKLSDEDMQAVASYISGLH